MWRAPLLAATLWASSAAGASMPTAGLSARWVADSLSPGSVAFWADSARGRFNATNAGSETTRPTAVALTRHCHTAVRFNGFQFLTVADDPSGNLDPVAQDFYYYAVRARVDARARRSPRAPRRCEPRARRAWGSALVEHERDCARSAGRGPAKAGRPSVPRGVGPSGAG